MVFGTKMGANSGSALNTEMPTVKQSNMFAAADIPNSMNRSAGVPGLGSNSAGAGMDFNGDGREDLLWQNTNGSVGVWYSNNTATPDARQIAIAPQGWELVGAGRFDGNGTTDLLWQNQQTGQIGTWDFSTQLGVMTPRLLATVAPSSGWEIDGLGDFNSDGITDIAWSNETLETNGTWTFNAAGGFTAAATQSNYADTVAAETSFYRSDIAGSGGYDDAIRRSGTNLQARVAGSLLGNNWSNVANLAQNEQVAALGDFNGDGRTDVVTRNGVKTTLYTSNGANTLTVGNMTGTTTVKDFSVQGLYDVAAESGWSIVSFKEQNFQLEQVSV